MKILYLCVEYTKNIFTWTMHAKCYHNPFRNAMPAKQKHYPNFSMKGIANKVMRLPIQSIILPNVHHIYHVFTVAQCVTGASVCLHMCLGFCLRLCVCVCLCYAWIVCVLLALYHNKTCVRYIGVHRSILKVMCLKHIFYLFLPVLCGYIWASLSTSSYSLSHRQNEHCLFNEYKKNVIFYWNRVSIIILAIYIQVK